MHRPKHLRWVEEVRSGKFGKKSSEGVGSLWKIWWVKWFFTCDWLYQLVICWFLSIKSWLVFMETWRNCPNEDIVKCKSFMNTVATEEFWKLFPSLQLDAIFSMYVMRISCITTFFGSHVASRLFCWFLQQFGWQLTDFFSNGFKWSTTHASWWFSWQVKNASGVGFFFSGFLAWKNASPKQEGVHNFHIIGDGHQPNSRGLYTHYKDSLLKVGWPSPI